MISKQQLVYLNTDKSIASVDETEPHIVKLTFDLQKGP